MASGTYLSTVIVSSTFDGKENIIIQCSENLKKSLITAFCSDNAFTNQDIIPEEKGIYKLECEVFWSDGENGILSESEYEWDITIKKVTTLFILKKVQCK